MSGVQHPAGSDLGAGAGRGFLKLTEFASAALAYSSLAAFLCLIATQIYRWFRQGEWTHIGISDALRIALTRASVNDSDPGRLATLLHWLEAPVDWLGLHKVLDVLPASLGLFLASVGGNALLIYCRERRDAANRC